MHCDPGDLQMRTVTDFLLVAVTGYLIGAVPFAYLIGKLFYRTDVRDYGSGNLGGSNTGRVLGKKAGVAVMTLDLLKVTLSVLLAARLSDHSWSMAWGALAAAVGHCYPVYVRFRGGKAVAALYGFLFALWVCGGYPALIFFLPLFTFLAVLAAFKIVSLSSIVSSLAALAYVILSRAHASVVCAAGAFALLILLRHSGNIRRMLCGTERKIRWLK